MHAANRLAWDEAAEGYEGWLEESVAQIRAGGCSLLPLEQALIGDLRGRCRRAIHLQCAGGRDTLSLWNLGAAEVVGIDFSPRMLDLARRLTDGHGCAGELGRGGRAGRPPRPRRDRGPGLHRARVAHVAPGSRRAGRGSCGACSLPDGRLVIFEGHPAEWLFDGDEDGGWMLTDYDYFAGPEASRGWAPGYIDRLSIPDGEQRWKFARAWTLGEVVTALVRSGLRLDEVTEYPVDWWAGHRDVRPEERGRLPLSFSVTATRGG